MIAYILAPDARRDVLEILAYIAANNAAAADRVRERLFDAFEKLPRGHAPISAFCPPFAPRASGNWSMSPGGAGCSAPGGQG